MKLKDDFLSLYQPGGFTLINTNSVLSIYIGLTPDLRYVLEFKGPFSTKKVTSSKAIEVIQQKDGTNCRLYFILQDNQMLDPFCILCEYIIEATYNITNAQDGYRIIIREYNLWRRMLLGSNNLLSENEIMGMIGELLFIKDVLGKQIGLSTAVSAWSGQDKTKKDFSMNNIWYEVKAVRYGRQSVEITSLEQLDSDIDGILAVFILEKMAEAFAGIKINSLARTIVQLLDDDPSSQDLFLDKLCSNGFAFNEEYDKYVFCEREISQYKVNDKFPRLTAKFVGKAVCRANYEILLSEIVDMKV